MLHLFTLCFALSLVTGRHIDPPDRDHLRRQFFPGPDTTSINWWPYPAWGASAAPAIPSPTEATPITAVTSLVAAVTGGGADTMQPILIPTPTISSFVSFPRLSSPFEHFSQFFALGHVLRTGRSAASSSEKTTQSPIWSRT